MSIVDCIIMVSRLRRLAVESWIADACDSQWVTMPTALDTVTDVKCASATHTAMLALATSARWTRGPTRITLKGVDERTHATELREIKASATCLGCRTGLSITTKIVLRCEFDHIGSLVACLDKFDGRILNIRH